MKPGLAFKHVASAILADVEPGFQPGGQCVDRKRTLTKSNRFDLSRCSSGRQDAALYGRQRCLPPLFKPAPNAFWPIVPALFLSATAYAAPETNDALTLLPPRAELPPSFWEAYGLWLICGIVLLAFVCVVAGLLLRRNPAPPLAPDLQARRELERLRAQPENGDTLSAVSRNFRRYLTAAFHLPADELTTAEFLKAVAAVDALDPELQSHIGQFLRRCDELKFSPYTVLQKPGEAERALELVALCEPRRTPAPQSPATASAPQAG